jgi:hypothetical protein
VVVETAAGAVELVATATPGAGAVAGETFAFVVVLLALFGAED